LGELLTRIEEGVTPEESVPEQLIFSDQELSRMDAEIRRVSLPRHVQRRLEHFASQLEFCESGGMQIEYKTKDTIKLAGADFGVASAQETGRDRVRDLGTQTKNGLSVRAMLSALHYVKAMAWFRGNGEVELDDVRQILPFVLHDKLVIHEQSPFFDASGNSVYRIDRISWIRNLFDLSCAELERADGDRDDPVAALNAQLEQGLEGLTDAEVRGRLVRIERLLAEWSRAGKLYGPLHDDILNLKYLHQRYTNYLEWLQWSAR
jgi:MoxR-like ATPase